MRFLKIKNTGLIDPQALSLLGASTKIGDASKIGQFGSGNKYALAFLLRNGYKVQIFSGLSPIAIETKTETFRGCDFDVIHIDGQRTSITAAMGKDWELWQALRELYCNALDEGGASLELVQKVVPVADETHFYVEAKPPIMQFIADFDNYFAENKRVLFACPEGRILEKSGKGVNLYRKGIRCFTSDKPSLYDYDFAELNITEDRLARYTWELEEKLWGLIYRCTNREVILKVLMGSTEYYEGDIADYCDVSSEEVSVEFRECIKTIRLAPKGYAGLLKPDEIHRFVIVPTKIYNSLRGLLSDSNVGAAFRITKQGGPMREVEMTGLWKATLEKALDFFKEVSFSIPYEIVAAIFQDKTILGVAYEGRIYVADLCFEKGANEVANTILEEFIHLKYSVSDETRGFQSAVITEFIAYMKTAHAFAL